MAPVSPLAPVAPAAPDAPAEDFKILTNRSSVRVPDSRTTVKMDVPKYAFGSSDPDPIKFGPAVNCSDSSALPSSASIEITSPLLIPLLTVGAAFPSRSVSVIRNTFPAL